MQNDRIVLDTNCLIAALSRHSEYYPIWEQFQAGRYTLCVTNEILDEYFEVIERKTSTIVAENVINLLLKSENVVFIDTYFRLKLIETDPDDNKFVDCAFASNATYIVSNDNHFEVLREITFPHIIVLKLKEFLKILNNEQA